MDRKGFVPILIILAVVLVGAVGATTYATIKNPDFLPNLYKNTIQNITSKETQEKEATRTITPTYLPSSTPKQTSTPLAGNKTPVPTKKPYTTPTPTPTSSSNSGSSCSYDLTGPTGAVKVNIKPQSGLVVGDQTVELQAKSGCKVLDGKSTDKQTLIARAGGNGYSQLNSVTYSTVPAGHYSVRIQYKGQWTGYFDVDAVSIQSRTVEIPVLGGTPPPTPTPTPAPKSTCSINALSKPDPYTNFDNPLTVLLVYSASAVDNKYMAGAQWDFDGNGSWDTNMAQSNGSIAHTFPSSGNHNVKLQLQMSDGEITSTCSKTVTVPMSE